MAEICKYAEDEICIFYHYDLSQQNITFKDLEIDERIDHVMFFWNKLNNYIPPTPCFVEEIPIEIFHKFPFLVELHICHYHLPVINSNLFSDHKFEQIRDLTFHTTGLETIEEDAFIRMKNLKRINITDDSLVSINHNIFKNNTELEVICLTGQRIRAINPKNFDNLKKLRLVNIRTGLKIYHVGWKNFITTSELKMELNPLFTNYLDSLQIAVPEPKNNITINESKEKTEENEKIISNQQNQPKQLLDDSDQLKITIAKLEKELTEKVEEKEKLISDLQDQLKELLDDSNQLKIMIAKLEKELKEKVEEKEELISDLQDQLKEKELNELLQQNQLEKSGLKLRIKSDKNIGTSVNEDDANDMLKDSPSSPQNLVVPVKNIKDNHYQQQLLEKISKFIIVAVFLIMLNLLTLFLIIYNLMTR